MLKMWSYVNGYLDYVAGEIINYALGTQCGGEGS
jgi:hypothetical protein